MNIQFACFTHLKSITCLVLVCSLVHAVGCSSESEGRSAELSGRVTLDAQPLDSGSLLLLSENGESGGASLNADGSFTLNCKPGKYLVAVTPLVAETGPEGVPLEPASPAGTIEIPKKYHDVGTSELKVEVGQGSNSADFELVSK